MKAFIIAVFLGALSLKGFGQQKSNREQWYMHLVSRDLKAATGVVLDGKKYARNGFDKLSAIRQEDVKKMLVYKDTADVRKYFADTTIKVVLVIATK